MRGRDPPRLPRVVPGVANQRRMCGYPNLDQRPLPIICPRLRPVRAWTNRNHGNSALRRLVSPMRELERDLPADAAPAAGVTVRLAGRADALEACRDSEVALLCVPDGEIASACAAVAVAVPPLQFVGHVSGASTLDALAPATDAGAPADAVALARELARRLEMRPFDVPEESRDAYHAAAAMASNLLVALEESAADLLERARVDSPSRDLLAPLVLRTAANWAERGAEALTGPIARGDATTVERHVDALRSLAPELLPVYEALAERARGLAATAEVRR